MIFDDTLELDEYETFEAPCGTLDCPVCGHAVCTFIGLAGEITLDPCEHVILVEREGEVCWHDAELEARYRDADEACDPATFLRREGRSFEIVRSDQVIAGCSAGDGLSILFERSESTATRDA